MIPLDEIDRTILRILLANGKTSQADIAEQVGIKAPSVFERIKKLQDRGIITGYSACVDGTKLGKNLTAFISVTLEGGARYADESSIIESIRAENSIEECHIVAGEESFIIKARVSTPLELQQLTTRLRRMEGVANTRTTVALTTPIDRPLSIE
ncbi:MAG: transcriptional regulator, AsnC family [Chloroflexi bacterium]|jgi:Lrp/AsnC family leucine-responsive transcriptional regulator|nr:transcriptional regulator, AsnC family [Chloroflexota bacterium]